MDNPEPTVTTLADSLFQHLQDAIVDGRMAPGSKISEPELARIHGVSRGPLREAIRRLESSGMVVRRANVGARVAALTLEGLFDIYYVREALEGMACRLAAQHMSATEVADLRRLLDAQRREMEGREAPVYYQQGGDLDFHFRIIQGSRNSKLIEVFWRDLYFQVRMYRAQFGTAGPRVTHALTEHGQIVDAIADGDGELAELLMRRHIRQSRLNAQRQLDPPAEATATAPTPNLTPNLTQDPP